MKEKRYIPTKTRKYLREEVGFGCPIPNCRSPFLTYHHFDPKYSEMKQHIKEGMIALCPTHHAQADVDTWSKQELYQLKEATNREPVKGSINWALKQSIVVIGNNYFFGDNFFLDIQNNEVFSLYQAEDGNVKINAILYNESMCVAARILNNDIIMNKMDIGDLNCSASGNKIRIESLNNSTYFEIDFQRIKYNEFSNMLDQLKNETKFYIMLNTMDKIIDGTILVVRFTANISTKKFTVNIGDESVDFDFKKLGFLKGSIKENALQGGFKIDKYLQFGCRKE